MEIVAKPPYWGLDVRKPCPPDYVLKILRTLPNDEGRAIYGHICWLTEALHDRSHPHTK